MPPAETDTESLLQASGAAGQTDAVLHILSTVVGRAALSRPLAIHPNLRAADCAIAYFAAWQHFTPADRQCDQRG